MATFHLLSCFIQDGNLRGLTICLSSQHSQVDARDENGQTVLMFSCQQGLLPFVRELIKHGADVNASDNDCWTPLLNAAREGHIDVVAELLDAGASYQHCDLGGWSPLVWASYKGHNEVAKLLLDKGADPNVTGQYHVSCLVWAAGRGHRTIVQYLLHYGAKVNVGDKYGTTALVWASRKGYVEIAEELLKSGANVDTAGMYSWTPLLVASKGNYPEVVSLILDYKPNVNAVDTDGCTALTIACKEGFTEIAIALLNSGAYVNLQDRNCDTNLIHAAKAGHMEIVEALLKKYADVDIQGLDRKTALYWAVEKSNVDIVRAILHVGPDMELSTRDGDTPLMKATRNRNVEIVQLLLDKKTKVSAIDKKGDTALHIAMRSHSKTIVELLLRNPKNSQLLYRPNRNGETPYNIDSRHQRSILAQIFGARRLNTNEDNENMLGYDLYGSALADILSEPSLSMPICLGLYAKWGSGKSFLLGKLRDEMKNFARQWIEPTFEFSWVSLLVVTMLSCGFIIFFSLATRLWAAGLYAGAGVFICSYIFMLVVKYGCDRYDWQYCYDISVYLARKEASLRLFLQVIFCHPPQKVLIGDGGDTQNIRFLFTDQTKVSGSSGDTNVAQMVASLFNSLEHEYGTLTTRFYQVFKPKSVNSPSWKWRRMCCIPNFFIFLGLIFCVVCIVVLLGFFFNEYNIHELFNTSLKGFNQTADKKDSNKSGDGGAGADGDDDDDDDDDDNDSDKFDAHKSAWMIARAVIFMVGSILILALLANLYTLMRMAAAVCYPQKQRVVRMVGGGSKMLGGSSGELKTDGHFQHLRSSVQLMVELVKCFDGFTGNQTRLVIIVDGLDSCEQDKVLHNLDAVHLLFSDLSTPFIILLAIDPHVIIKAIEVNIHRVFHDSSISGHNYLRNIVHLPFYLQNAGLRRVRVAQKTASHSSRKTYRSAGVGSVSGAAGKDLDDVEASARRLSSESSMSIPERVKQLRSGNSSKGSKKLKPSDSIASSVGNVGRPGGAHDLTRVLLTDDYFSDVNPRSMRRLMNVMYITGRLLKAFNIEFNWYHLASWVNITEQWPYRTSWIIFYYEKHEESLDDGCSLKSIYDKVRDLIPMSRDVEPLLEIDRDERKFEVFLNFHKASLHVGDLKVFLPFTINLDPYIRKTIREEQNNLEEMNRHEGIQPNSQMARPWLTSQTNVHRRLVPSKEVLASTSNWMYPFGSPMVMPPPAPAMWPGQSLPAPALIPTAPTVAVTPSAGSYCGSQHPSETSDHPTERKVPNLFSGKTLDTLSVSGVCSLLSSLDGIDPGRLQRYKDMLVENNIHGRVLLSCDLDELKKVMCMSFGDWEVFRVALLTLREQLSGAMESYQSNVHFNVKHLEVSRQESGGSSAGAGAGAGNVASGIGVQVNVDAPAGQGNIKPHSPMLPMDDAIANKDLLPVTRERSSSLKHQPINSLTIHKQVTLEEQMIVGALQSLNDQAEEDTRFGSLQQPVTEEESEAELDQHQLTTTTLSSMQTGGQLIAKADSNVGGHGTDSSYDGNYASDDYDYDYDDDQKETEVLYLRASYNSQFSQSPIGEFESHHQMDSLEVKIMEAVNSGFAHSEVSGMPSAMATATTTVATATMTVATSPSAQSDYNLHRFKRLLASVSTGNPSPNRKRVDSDVDNSENVPLVSNHYQLDGRGDHVGFQLGPSQGGGRANNSDEDTNVVEMEDNYNESRASSMTTTTTLALAIDSPHFRPFHSVPSCPEMGRLTNSSHYLSKRSAGSTADHGQFLHQQHQQQQLQSAIIGKDLLEMLGGNETVL